MPKLCELLHRELDEDLLVFGAEHLDLRNVGKPKQLGADGLDVIAELAMGETVTREAVDDSVVPRRPSLAIGQFGVPASPDRGWRASSTHP